MTSRYVPNNLRRLVRERAHGYCEYCWSPEAYSPASFSIEHIHPLDLGGLTAEENLALACQGCNSFKYNKIEALDPLSLQLAPLYHPRCHSWREHFAWSDDGLRLVGLTPTGRATLESLDLNREQVVNLRRLLGLIGKQPPPEAN
jgi:hypothetical protein